MAFIDRSPLLAGLNYAKGQILCRLKLRQHDSGSTACHQSLDDAVRYVRTVVADYVEYGAGGDVGRLQGKDILEIGPGDNLGVALLLLANGTRTVTCIDGFTPRANAQHNARLYAAIYNSLSGEQRERVRDVVTLHPEGTATLGGERLICRYGDPIDNDAVVLERNCYDIIVSRAVLEHLGDLAIGWRQMVRCLRPDGEMWHKVDFRCHNLFGRIHPLYFLTVPRAIWNLITRPDPTLNRMRLPSYREFAVRDFHRVRIYITQSLGEDEISPHVDRLQQGKHYFQNHLDMIRSIRPRLQEPFSLYSEEDLLVMGVFLIACGVRA